MQFRICARIVRGVSRGSAADAVRFSVSGNAEGIVKIVWILEKDHAPVEHGLLEYAESTGAFVAEPAGRAGGAGSGFY